MLERFPLEIWSNVLDNVSQLDKCSLMLVSQTLYNKTVHSLYKNLYLNETPVVFIDRYPIFGNNWSVLYFKNMQDSKSKFSSLIEVLKREKRLIKLIHHVYCTWHLDHNLLLQFTRLICNNENNVLKFENFLHIDILQILSRSLNHQLQSVDFVPHAKLPGPAYASYLPSVTNLVKNFDWRRINTLTVYVDMLLWVPNFFQRKEKLYINDLCLNLRNDNFSKLGPLSRTIRFTDFLDVNELKRLSILSWYEKETFDIYQHFGLYDLLNFTGIEEVALLSTFYNETFVRNLASTLTNLKRLKLDFMFDSEVSSHVITLLSENTNITYLDCKFPAIDIPMIDVLDLDVVSRFEISVNCMCGSCSKTLQDVILKKYFPTKESFVINTTEDIHTRHFINQMLKLYPITPYFHFISTSPCIAYRSQSIEALARKVNHLLNDIFYDYESDTSSNKITTDDLISLYHCIFHSMRRTFDYFLKKFPNIQFLILNDLPSIIKTHDGQRFMEPIFYSSDYKSNQFYEIVNDESLFT